MSDIVLTNQYKVKIHPESKTDTIPAPKGSVGEIVSKRAASQKRYLMSDGKEVVYCWNKYAPVHYKDSYAELAGSKEEQWKEIDPTFYEDKGDHLLFTRMPQTVKVFKDKFGYEITDRQTGKVMSAELLEIDDEPVSLSSKIAKVTFEAEVRHNGVRFWKETAEGGPTKFKWQVKESGPESRLKFREAPEAFDMTKVSGDISDLSEEEKEQALVSVSVVKSPTKDGFTWVEQVDKTGVKIDTDFTGETSDGYMTVSDFTYRNTRDDVNTAYTDSEFMIVGQNQSSNDLYRVYRGFLDFDTSSVPAASQVNLKLTVTGDYAEVDTDLCIIKQTWYEPLTSYHDPTWTGCLGGTEDDDVWRNINGVSPNTEYTSGNLDASYINVSGDTKYSLIVEEDLLSSAPVYANGNEHTRLYTSDSSTSSYRPKLAIIIPVIPVVTTSDCDKPDHNSTKGNGNIVYIGDSDVTRRGFCYMEGTTGDPDTTDSVEYEDGTFSEGAFSLTIDGLSAYTNYRIRAYAVNDDGTGYGDTITVKTHLGVPANLASVSIDATEIEMDWDSVSDASGYELCYREKAT